jgi:hypothetical protein
LRNFILNRFTSSHEAKGRNGFNTDWHLVDNLNQPVSIISVLENHILDLLSNLSVNGIWKLFNFFFDELELFGCGRCGPCFVESRSVPKTWWDCWGGRAVIEAASSFVLMVAVIFAVMIAISGAITHPSLVYHAGDYATWSDEELAPDLVTDL